MLVKRRNSARLFYSTLGYVHSGNNGAFLSTCRKPCRPHFLSYLTNSANVSNIAQRDGRTQWVEGNTGGSGQESCQASAQAMPRAGRWHWFCWANPSQVGLGDICLHSQQPHRFAIHQRVHMALLMQILEECCCWC